MREFCIPSKNFNSSPFINVGRETSLNRKNKIQALNKFKNQENSHFRHILVILRKKISIFLKKNLLKVKVKMPHIVYLNLK